MKPWLRLTLVLATVGGGFGGVAVVGQALLSSPNNVFGYTLLLTFGSLYAFVAASGLLFVHNPRRVEPLLGALAIQVPWFSSPFLVYKFTAGFDLSVGVLAAGLNFFWAIGSSFRVVFFQSAPFGAGVNLCALALFILVLGHWKTMSKGPEESISVLAASAR